MTTPPTGTVTFLFTDIEGSTERWERDRAAMRDALARHNAILHGAIEDHGGYVFKTVGDAFCASFASAGDAVAAAIDAQRVLHGERFQLSRRQDGAPEGPLRVRMGIHTGLVDLEAGDYHGRPVNRVARLMSAGHGGQILLSLAAAQLVRDALPDGARLLDLGTHRLRDLEHPEQVFRLAAPGMPRVETPPDTAEQLDAADPRARTARAEALPDAACPYRGLHAFREEDASFFFGREVFTTRLVEALATKAMVGVIGPSGSGKSSVVFAGLLPALRAGKTGGDAGAAGDAGHATRGGNSEHEDDAGDDGARAGRGEAGADSAEWTVLELRPGAEPFRSLAGTLVPLLEKDQSETARLVEMERLATALADGTLSVSKVIQRIRQRGDIGALLMVVDQFEELFTLCPDPEAQRGFQDLLFEAAHGTTAGAPLKLALTLRADFMGHATAYRPFSEAVQDHNVILGPMDTEELARVIAKPAELQNRAFESGLVERILDDVGEEAGTLPLLQFALTKLWDKQEAGWLTHEAYEEIGRVEGAVARHADAVFEGLPAQECELGRKVIVQMVRPGEGTEDTRRVATKDELGQEGWRLVRKLADARLVVTNRDDAGQETAEVVHEALIRTWGRLKDWMQEDRRFRMWQERLRFGILQWEAADRDAGALLRGVPLAEAEQWLAERGEQMTVGEREYVRSSVALREARAAEARSQAERERALEARGRRLLRVVAGVSVVAAVVGIVLAGLAWQASRAERRQAEAGP